MLSRILTILRIGLVTVAMWCVFPIQVDVSPLENAIELFEETNHKIKALIDQHRNDPSLRVDPLGMLLNGVVDAAVNGGINNYRVHSFAWSFNVRNKRKEFSIGSL